MSSRAELYSAWHNTIRIGALIALVLLFGRGVSAQDLNWDGQTGAFLTPFAYTSPSPAHGIGRPVVAFHFMNAGGVIGNDFQTSITAGVFKYAEFGYTRSFSSAGSTPFLSPLFSGGYNTFHGKVNFLPENFKQNKAVPALAVGFVARTQVRRVYGVLTATDKENYDFYVVGTKTVTEIRGLPIVLSLGTKVTDASIMAIAGNASAWQTRMFGTVAFVVKGPAHSTMILGAEATQQPGQLEGLPGTSIPTTMAYFVRLVPRGELPLNLDFGVGQVVNSIAPGVNLQARSQFAMGMSYRF